MANTATVNRLTHNFISATGTYDNFLKAKVDMSLFNPFGTDNMIGLMQTLGKEETADQMTGSWYEDTRSNIAFVAVGSVSGSAGATVTQTVDTGSRFTFGSKLPYTATNSQTVVLPQKGDILMYSNGVQGLVLTDPSSNAYTVTPLKAAALIPAVTTDDVIINMGQRTEEGSGSPKPLAFRPSEHKWTMSFKKTSVEVTDVGHTETIDLNIGGKNVWTFKNWEKATENHNLNVGAELLVGETIDNPLALAALKVAPAGTGYIPYVKANGRTNLTTTTTGVITEAMFEQFVIENDSINAPKDYCFYGGSRFKLNAQKTLRSLSGEAIYATFGIGEKGKQIAVNLEHNSLEYGGYNMHFKNIQEFNHPGLLGADGFDYSLKAMAIPMGVKEDYVSIVNFGRDGYKFGYNEKIMSGINGENQLDEDIMRYTMKTGKAIKVKGQRLHSIWEPE